MDYLISHLTFATVKYDYSGLIIDFNYYKKPDLYIIATTGLDFAIIMEFLHGLDNWYPQAKFIVIYQGQGQTSLVDDLDLMLKILMKHYVVDVVIVKVPEENHLHLELYTYDPYKYENLNDPDMTINYLGGSHLIEDVYRTKLPRYWRNSSVLVTPVSLKPYVISIPDKTGIDMDVTELIHATLQTDLHYEEQVIHYDWGWKAPNGSYVVVFRILQLGLTDFVIGHFHFRDPANLIDFDYTFSYTEDPLIWIVPCPVPISNWSGLILIFSKTTWYSILVTLLISLIFWQVIGRIVEKGRYFSTLYSIEVPFLLFLSLGLPIEPRKVSMKLMYISSWFFGLILTTSWLSQLTVFLTHETYEERIKSLPEVIDRGISLGVHPELAEMYGDSGEEMGTYIKKHFIECDLDGGCWNKVAYQKDMASITTKRILRYLTYDRYMSEKGEQLMIAIEDLNVNIDFTVMFFPKGHPMCSRVSQLLMWIREGGFINYFDVHVNYKQAITNRRELFNPNHLETKELNVEQMLLPFALLVVGLAFATISFLYELVEHKIRRKHFRTVT